MKNNNPDEIISSVITLIIAAGILCGELILMSYTFIYIYADLILPPFKSYPLGNPSFWLIVYNVVGLSIGLALLQAGVTRAGRTPLLPKYTKRIPTPRALLTMMICGSLLYSLISISQTISLVAIKNNEVAAIQKAIAHGIDVNRTIDEKTPLMYADEANAKNVADLLRAHGARKYP